MKVSDLISARKLGAWEGKGYEARPAGAEYPAARGATIGEAQEACATAIGSALNALAEGPRTIAGYDGAIALIYPGAHGTWSYTILHGDAVPGDVGPRSVCAMGETRRDCERSARAHLAQLAFNGDRDGADLILDADDRAGHARWVAWQLAYRAAAANGADDAAARRIADRV